MLLTRDACHRLLLGEKDSKPDSITRWGDFVAYKYATLILYSLTISKNTGKSTIRIYGTSIYAANSNIKSI